MKLTLAALLLGMMSRMSSSATATPDTFVGSFTQMIFEGLGCKEDNFHERIRIEVDITRSLVVMEENMFCESDVHNTFSGQNYTQLGAYTTACDDDEKTVLFTWYACHTTDCSDCDDTISMRWKTPMSVWDEPTDETCFEMDIQPPYDPIVDLTEGISYRLTGDPSTHASIVVKNSCMSKSLARGNTLSSKPSSSGRWVGLNVCWYYLVASVGFALYYE
ncbi:hypothetical protein QTG54_008106 [Skeletonema marinoi]|uniref:Uncharacterized protein n=1 Tax=Skeletonema marinoi TaxID=267567 RepID=A0AAD8Y8A7_9STRA|nr:hypothetical protein QTG54_008106 [Skeletonema marinoi]